MTNKLMKNGENPPANSQNPVASKRASGWTPERRLRQAEWMRTHKPWLKSTGPRTESGKRHVGQNACKHGFRSQTFKELLRLMARQRQFVKGVLERR